MTNRLASSLCLAVVLGAYSGCNYVTDLQQAAPVAQPTAPPPSVAVEPAPVDPIVPTPEPPAPPKPDLAAFAKWQAGYTELQQIFKTIDDVAFGRRGNINEQQTAAIFNECQVRLTKVGETVPELTMAAESLGSIIVYANPHSTSITKEKRLDGYQAGVGVLQSQLSSAKPPQPQE